MFSLFDDTEVKCSVVGPEGAVFQRLKTMLGENGITLDRALSFSDLAALSRSETMELDYLFIDIDGLGGIIDIIDRLADMRLALPSVPTILVSAEFEMDDFDLNRRTLGDVSLRNPILFAPLELALFESVKNNLKWRESVVYYRQSIAA